MDHQQRLEFKQAREAQAMKLAGRALDFLEGLFAGTASVEITTRREENHTGDGSTKNTSIRLAMPPQAPATEEEGI